MNCCVEYVWVDAGGNLRSKTKVYHGLGKELTLDSVDEWNFDGSSTGQAEGHYSEIILRPIKMVRDPFRKSLNKIVLCECYNQDGTPASGNHRHNASKIFDNALVHSEIPWYGIEQEYTLLGDENYGDNSNNRPLAWTKNKMIERQGPYYCSVGTSNAIGREIVEEHLKVCLDAYLDISGINAEVMPGQWEYQVGPCTGIDSGDQLLLSRYFLHRVAEKHGVNVSFHPKPMTGDWNGAGAHVNYSTESMRNDVKCENILKSIKKLENRHMDHITVYGVDNDKRLTGEHETSSMTDFSYGVGNRGASIRIPTLTDANGKGYIEDRRPASNMDPYIVTSIIAETTLLK
jgi:glutamine synthetase